MRTQAGWLQSCPRMMWEHPPHPSPAVFWVVLWVTRILWVLTVKHHQAWFAVSRLEGRWAPYEYLALRPLPYTAQSLRFNYLLHFFSPEISGLRALLSQECAVKRSGEWIQCLLSEVCRWGDVLSQREIWFSKVSWNFPNPEGALSAKYSMSVQIRGRKLG